MSEIEKPPRRQGRQDINSVVIELTQSVFIFLPQSQRFIVVSKLEGECYSGTFRKLSELLQAEIVKRKIRHER